MLTKVHWMRSLAQFRVKEPLSETTAAVSDPWALYLWAIRTKFLHRFGPRNQLGRRRSDPCGRAPSSWVGGFQARCTVWVDWEMSICNRKIQSKMVIKNRLEVSTCRAQEKKRIDAKLCAKQIQRKQANEVDAGMCKYKPNGLTVSCELLQR